MDEQRGQVNVSVERTFGLDCSVVMTDSSRIFAIGGWMKDSTVKCLKWEIKGVLKKKSNGRRNMPQQQNPTGLNDTKQSK